MKNMNDSSIANQCKTLKLSNNRQRKLVSLVVLSLKRSVAVIRKNVID